MNPRYGLDRQVFGTDDRDEFKRRAFPAKYIQLQSKIKKMMQLVSAVRLEATKFMETTGTVYIIIIFFFPPNVKQVH